MRLVSIKSPNELKLAGINVEFEKEDSTLQGVKLTTEAGDIFVIRSTESYSRSVKVLKRQDYETVTKHCLKGQVLSIPILEYFEHHHEASARKSDLELKDSSSELEISEVEVKVDDDGKPVKDDVIPF